MKQELKETIIPFLPFNKNTKGVIRTASGNNEQICIIDKVIQGGVLVVICVQQRCTFCANGYTKMKI